MQTTCRVLRALSLTALLVLLPASRAQQPATNAPPGSPTKAPEATKPEFPPHTEILKDYEQVVSSIDKAPTLL